MKEFKKKTSFILVLLLSIFLGLGNVFASGSATFKFAGPTTATLNQEITVTLAIDNISGVNGGIKGFSGNLDYDKTILELVSGSAHSGATITGGFNKTALKFNGLGMTGNIESTETIYDFKFKAIGNGSTDINVLNGKISDDGGQAATVSVSKLNVTVGAAAPKSTVCTLDNLVPESGSLSPSFNKNTLSYTLSTEVANDKTSFSFTATKTDSKSSVSGTTCSLSKVGANTCNIVVTAEDGTTKKTYVVTVNRKDVEQQQPEPGPTPTPTEKSNDSYLTVLGVDGYSLSPAFDKDTLSYTVEVPKTASKVKVTATKSSGKASVTGTGDVTLTGEDLTHSVVVTAEDGTTKTYSILIKMVEPVVKDTDNKLKSLDVKGYTLKPAFSSDKTTYDITVGEDVTKLDITALPNSEKATVKITGNSLKVGTNQVYVTVTAESGAQRNYVINVTRPGSGKTTTTTSKKSSDTSIDKIIINSPHKITPAINKEANYYEVTVPYDVEKLDLIVSLVDPKAKYTIENNGDFLVGETKAVTINITAEDGTTRKITLNVTRNTEEDGTKAKDIEIGGGIEIDFDPEKPDYSIEVGPGVNKIDFKKIEVPEGSTYKIIGNENLKEGKNTIIVSVTDKDGYTRNYTFTVTKAAKTILGLKKGQFFVVLGIILGLLVLFLLLLFLLRRKKDDEEEEKTQPIQPVNPPTPVIDFKPEFNFGSRNGTDDDTVYAGGSLNQDSSVANKSENELPKHEEPKYIDTTMDDAKEIPYDPYDEIVTKDELIDAIHEGLASKNPEKLKMLLEQEELNRKKEALKKKEEEDR